jgi:hypothetical protein
LLKAVLQSCEKTSPTATSAPSDAIPTGAIVVIDGDEVFTSRLKAFGRHAGTSFHDLRILAMASTSGDSDGREDSEVMVDDNVLATALRTVFAGVDELVYQLGLQQVAAVYWVHGGLSPKVKSVTTGRRAR